jgi:hypothetical protein
LVLYTLDRYAVVASLHPVVLRVLTNSVSGISNWIHDLVYGWQVKKDFSRKTNTSWGLFNVRLYYWFIFLTSCYYVQSCFLVLFVICFYCCAGSTLCHFFLHICISDPVNYFFQQTYIISKLSNLFSYNG